MEERGAMPETAESEAIDTPAEDEVLVTAGDAEGSEGDAPETPGPAPTLDEMVAELAKSVAQQEPASPEESVEPVASAEDQEPEDQNADSSDVVEPVALEVEEPDSVDPVASVEATATAAVPAEYLPLVDRLWTRAPFWVVAAAFVVLVGTIVYLMWPLATGAFTTHPLYSLFVMGGAALVLIDLVTGMAVWLSARSRAQDDEKAGLATTLWIRALAWTAAGVALWWIGLALLDLRHAGLIG